MSYRKDCDGDCVGCPFLTSWFDYLANDYVLGCWYEKLERMERYRRGGDLDGDGEHGGLHGVGCEDRNQW